MGCPLSSDTCLFPKTTMNIIPGTYRSVDIYRNTTKHRFGKVCIASKKKDQRLVCAHHLQKYPPSTVCTQKQTKHRAKAARFAAVALLPHPRGSHDTHPCSFPYVFGHVHLPPQRESHAYGLVCRDLNDGSVASRSSSSLPREEHGRNAHGGSKSPRPHWYPK